MRKLVIPKEFLGAFKAGHRAASRPFIDEELSIQLLNKVINENCPESRKHLEYITKFNNEFHKNVIKKGDPNSLHITDELRRDCYARENAKNRDVLSRSNFEQDLLDVFYFNEQNQEDAFIENIDSLSFLDKEICN